MSDALRAKLQELRELGVDEIDFHPDGSVRRVKFGPDPTTPSTGEEVQHDTPSPKAPRRAPTGGLVPRRALDE